MATTRVYILAKELGVKSGAIVEKCQAEGLDIKNHMSTISAGLAATVREWFTEGEHATTVESAKRVDLRKVRVKKKKRKAAKKKAVSQKPKSDEAATAVATAPAAEVVEAPEAPTEQPPAAPEPVVPAGPMLEKPSPAQLSGPSVIRIEPPEPEAKPRPRAKLSRRKRDTVLTEPLMYTDQAEQLVLPTKPGGATTKGKKVAKTHGRRREPLKEDLRGLRLPQKLRERDMQERRARLEAASAESLRLRPSRKIETKRPAGTAVWLRPEKAVVSTPISVKGLSVAMAVKVSEIIRKLMGQGIMATANQVIAADAAELVAMEFGVELQIERKFSLQEQVAAEFESRERNNLQNRCPVATMLGHVDHGKTSLLDRIRSSNVVKVEAGGITQHIGAYQVEWDGKAVTFLDTPGHEAFTSMRARGANMTDIVVLVVAADDGVMPQTIEAINHAKAAETPIIVALNKIDLPGCDINRVYGQLAEHGLTVVEWGGKTDVVKTSAVTDEGINDLLEHLDYTAELLELKADPNIPATGWVVEAKMTSQQGPVTTLLVKEGQLCRGDVVLAGGSYGKVRTLRDSHDRNTKAATSSMPVEITGLNDVPQAGDRFYCLNDINEAKAAAEENKSRLRQQSLAQRQRITLDNLFSHIEAGNIKELNLIVRADVQGSVDVLLKYLSELSTEEVKVKILHAAVGGITEGDMLLAEASKAIIIGFNVVPEDAAARLAEQNKVDIRLYNVIYRITEDLRKAMEGLLEPEMQERQLARAAVRNTFKISSIGTIAGAYVTSGVVNKNAKLRLIRDNIVLKDGCAVESLRRFKEDVREVKAGLECGIKIAGFDDVKSDDVLEFYEIIEVQRSL